VRLSIGLDIDIMDSAIDSLKRKRSPSDAGAALNSRTASRPNLSINYLARHSQDDLPLVTKEFSLNGVLHACNSYSNVIERGESLASNLGIRALAPILIKRFERCFDAPPKVISSHAKAGASGSGSDDTSHQVTWLEVIEFARAHPSQFTLTTFSEGSRVCQFYYPQKQTRVQVSEEDFLFINSGRCQELIPPLPIWEDEEKEYNTCELLEIRLKELTNAADLVAARTRQLTHRLKGRRAAIVERRAEGGSGTPAQAGAPQAATTLLHHAAHPSGNTRPYALAESGDPSSASVRDELLRHFESLAHNNHNAAPHNVPHSRHHSVAGHVDHGQHPSRATDGINSMHHERVSNASSLSPAPPNGAHKDASSRARPGQHSPSRGHQATHSHSHRQSPNADKDITHTASGTSKHNFSRPLPPALESSQPYRPICQASMDSLPRGQRVIPPCDRCRRLRMDCLKNLTSCAGCTRKHARCHWRDVTSEEVSTLDHNLNSDAIHSPSHADSHMSDGHVNGDAHSEGHHDDSEDDESNPLGDLEALEQIEESGASHVESAPKKDDSQKHANAAVPPAPAAEAGEKSATNHEPVKNQGMQPPDHREHNATTAKPDGSNSSHASSQMVHNNSEMSSNSHNHNINKSNPTSISATLKRPSYDPVHENDIPYSRLAPSDSAKPSMSPPPPSQPPRSAATGSSEQQGQQGGRSGFQAVNGSSPSAGSGTGWRTG
jgi:hypothetical protein